MKSLGTSCVDNLESTCTLLAKENCEYDKECPAIYESAGEKLLIQGKLLSSDHKSKFTLGHDEDMVVISKQLLIEAATKLGLSIK